MDGELNSVFLPEDSKIIRQPISPEIPRSDQFMAEFDQRGIFYSVFRDISGKRVWFLGPELMNLERSVLPMRVEGAQSGTNANVHFIKNYSVCVGYVDLPEADVEVYLRLDGKRVKISINKNLGKQFKNARIVYCINKDNDLQWIKDWAQFYALEHSADSFFIFDNNSESYEACQIEATLYSVAGVKSVCVINWPFKFGALDPVAQQLGQPFHKMFAQPVIHMELYLRYGMLARSILNVDIDEFVVSKKGRSIFEVAERRLFGCIKFERLLVENVTEFVASEPRAKNFPFRAKANLGRQDRFKKWAFSPRRVKRVKKIALPNTHWVDGVINPYPTSKEFVCYHFAGISSGWRANDDSEVKAEWQHRRHIAEPYDPKKHVKDEFLAKKLNEIFGQ